MKIRDWIYTGITAALIGLMGNACDYNSVHPATSYNGDVRVLEKGSIFGKSCYIKGKNFRFDGITYCPSEVIYFVNKNDNPIEDEGEIKCNPDNKYLVTVAKKKKDIISIVQETFDKE